MALDPIHASGRPAGFAGLRAFLPGRVQLFELNERPECPRFIRDSVTEVLGTGLRWASFGSVLGPAFADFARRAGVRDVLDLCSGTGVPAELLLDWLVAAGEPAPRITLSDLFPHVPALEASCRRHPGSLRASIDPIDATAVPDGLGRDARLIVNSFHHFAPAQAASIVRDAVAARAALMIYEGFPRDLRRLIPAAPAMPLALLVNPLRAPRQRLAKAIFTYALPLIPLAAGWDGLVSVLRIYGEAELRAMTSADDGYRWEYREIPHGRGARAVVFTGIPEERIAIQEAA